MMGYIKFCDQLLLDNHVKGILSPCSLLLLLAEFSWSVQNHVSDIDECLEGGLGTCGQTCINVPGSYICSCRPGYTLDIDKRSCYVNGKVIFFFDD